MNKILFILLCSAFLLAGTQKQSNLTRDIDLPDVQNSGNVVKILHDYEINEGETVNKDLKIIGGDLKVAGTVNGEITIIGGDVELLSTAVINGRLIVLGGDLQKNSSAQVRGQIIELNEDTWAFSRKKESDEKLESEELEEEESIFTFRSDPYSDDGWLRYNRQEGVYLQANLFIQSSYIRGATFYGGVGRSFHRNKYYGVLGLDQLFHDKQLELFVEGYSRAATADTWRFSDGANSLAAFFIHEDFLDWYYTEGFTAGANFRLPKLLSLGMQYEDEDQSFMNKVADWSMFGGDKEFRAGYQIEDGRDVAYNYQVGIGGSYRWKEDDHMTMLIEYTHTSTTSKSDFDYTKDEFRLDSFVPFADEIGFHFSARYGGIIGDHFGPQQTFYLGGLGSLRGYNWKEFSGDHFLLVSSEIIFKHCSVFYERGTTWNYSEDTLDKDFIKKFQGYTGRESAGISLGDSDVRLDITTQVGKHRDRGVTINLILNDI